MIIKVNKIIHMRNKILFYIINFPLFQCNNAFNNKQFLKIQTYICNIIQLPHYIWFMLRINGFHLFIYMMKNFIIHIE